MSKLVVIFYSGLILIQSFNINIEDISKFNALLQHADYHKEIYGDNFFKFLSEHYGEQMASHQTKHKQHDDLPFKDEHHVFSHINSSFTLFETITYSSFSLSYINVTLNFHYKESNSLFEKTSVFQPPKLA
ncbi:hypothetical protein [uncultured Algibacter sp.]|uniref:hypothetical protein n=1 Tax=uncultured Algibacter sp. TaxID=298659 RepID=UPI00262C326D|nr:hypothetical protein [uncultured Algibacter sp.]